MLRNIQPYLYQQTIFGTCSQKNTLVVLPTGMGKTLIALMLISHRLQNYPQSKVLLLTPTRPLCDQHYETCKNHLEIPPDKIVLVTGTVAPEKRKEIYETAQIIISTPQTIEHDLINRRYPLAETSLLIIDEAHRAVKDYSYVWIAKQYQQKAKHERILALTASPGSDQETIQEVIHNLGIESIEVRTNDDPDVKPYAQEMDIQRIHVQLPPAMKQIQKTLKDCYHDKLQLLKQHSHLANIQYYTKTQLLALQGQLQGQIAQGHKDPELFKSISIAAEAIKIQHGLELLETQGLEPLEQYLTQIQTQAQAGKSKAVQNLVQDLYFKTAVLQMGKALSENQEHPKLTALKKILLDEVKKNPFAKIIVFNQYRDQIQHMQKEFNQLGLNSEIFVGQAKKKESGLSQKEQKQVIDRFRNGEFNVLLSTSVGEEGLDIPVVDLVVFYESIPSAIRSIQRKGRTARGEKGRVILLTTKDTRDESYHWTAHHKEKRMHRILQDFKHQFQKLSLPKEEPLSKFISEEQNIQIYVDHREKDSTLLKELIDLGVHLKLEKLDVADYLLSERVAVEFKEVSDFVNSIIDGRLLEQLKELVRYERPLLVIQGTEDLYSQRNIHPNALRGMLATITVSYKIPILQTKNPKETAALFAIIAKREQEKQSSPFTLHTSKPLSDKELQEYIVSSLPNIGPQVVKPLLTHFGTVRSVFTASEQDLQHIPLIGPLKSKKIKEILDKKYEP
ncbi:MAG: DEAD/DEAH box helicase [Nanoarchaeota archaeon]